MLHRQLDSLRRASRKPRLRHVQHRQLRIQFRTIRDSWVNQKLTFANNLPDASIAWSRRRLKPAESWQTALLLKIFQDVN